jgi:hypothetical protein
MCSNDGRVDYDFDIWWVSFLNKKNIVDYWLHLKFVRVGKLCESVCMYSREQKKVEQVLLINLVANIELSKSGLI